MKKILLTFFASIFLFSNMSFAAGNKRDVIAYWDQGVVKIIGHHRPYSTITITENEKEITKVQADDSGTFEASLSLSKDTKHFLTFSAIDHLGREILKEDGSPDILTKTILPGLKNTGTVVSEDGNPIFGAQIDLKSSDGRLLNRFNTNQYGEFQISNAPKGAILEISGEHFLTSEAPFNTNGTLQITLMRDPYAPESEKIFPAKEGNNEEGNQTQKSEQKNRNIAWILAIIVASIVIGGFAFYIWWRKKMHPEED